MNVYENLERLGITLPKPPVPAGLYVPVRRMGNLLFSSGQGPTIDGKPVIVGKVGLERTEEEGQQAARLCIINILSILHEELGDLNKVKNVVKLLGFVASDPSFNRQPFVINGGSQLLLDVFGENGRHARSAIGTNVLPNNITVEIEAVFEVQEE